MVWGFRVGSGLRVQRFRTQGLKVWLGSGSRFRFQLGSWYSRVWGFRIISVAWVVFHKGGKAQGLCFTTSGAMQTYDTCPCKPYTTEIYYLE